MEGVAFRKGCHVSRRSTSSVGWTYELFVKRACESLLKDDGIAVHHRRKYLGRSGQTYEIDLSFTFKKASVDFLVLIECKHYAHKVRLNDVATFAFKLDDIGAQKGILFSTIGFQRGVLKIARSSGIALVKVDKPEGLDMVISSRGPAINLDHAFGEGERYESEPSRPPIAASLMGTGIDKDNKPEIANFFAYDANGKLSTGSFMDFLTEAWLQNEAHDQPTTRTTSVTVLPEQADQNLPERIQELLDAADDAGYFQDDGRDEEALQGFLFTIGRYEELKSGALFSAELTSLRVCETIAPALFWAGYGLLYKAMNSPGHFAPKQASKSDPALVRAAKMLEECNEMLCRMPTLRDRVRPWSVEIELANVYACLGDAGKGDHHYNVALAKAESDHQKAKTHWARSRAKNAIGDFTSEISDCLAAESFGVDPPGGGYYNAACAAAQLGRAVPSVVRLLGDAEKVGYPAREHARSDSDFHSIRGSTEFQEYLG
jgi:hypothetical protein